MDRGRAPNGIGHLMILFSKSDIRALPVSHLSLLPQGRYVLSEIFVIVRRFSQKLQAHKLNMIKRGKQARLPKTRWRIWACDVTPTLRMQTPRKLFMLYQTENTFLWLFYNFSTPEGRAVSVTHELDLSLLCRIWLFGRHLVSLAKIAESWAAIIFSDGNTRHCSWVYISRDLIWIKIVVGKTIYKQIVIILAIRFAVLSTVFQLK